MNTLLMSATGHVVKHVAKVITHVAEHKAANHVVNKAVASTHKTSGGGWNIHSPLEFFIHFPWIIPILLVGGYFGMNYGWKKLELKYNINGEPLASWRTYITRIRAIMYKEDRTAVFIKPDFLVRKFPNFIWQQYWRYFTIATIVDLLVLFVYPNILAYAMILPLIFIGHYGSKHIRIVFKSRMRTLMQMFEVAEEAMKYQRGANLNPWGYIQISGWGNPENPDATAYDNLYAPGPTYVMFNAKFQSENQGLRDSFERNFNGTVSDQHTWIYEWESANNRVLCNPVPFIPEKTVQYPFPDKRPWNIFPVGEASGGKEAFYDVTRFPHLLIAGTTGSGKAVDTRYSIATPSGWTTMGKIRIGDYVFDENGKPTKVIGVSEINNDADLYRVKFSDGSYVDADGEHLWRTETRQSLHSRWNSKRKIVARRSLITEKGVANLRELLSTLSPIDEITIQQLASCANVNDTSPWLLDIAKEVGHVGEVQYKMQQHYKAQIVRQAQKVTRYPAKSAWKAFAEYNGSGYAVLSTRRDVFKSRTNLANAKDTVTVMELVKVTGLSRNSQVHQFLAREKIKGTVSREIVELNVPDRISEKSTRFAKSYNGRAIIEAVLARIETPANDQRYKKTFSEVITTKEIMETLKHGALGTHLNHSVPVTKPLELPEADLPIAPYLFGCWLGDGLSREGAFCGIDHEIARNIESDGYNLSEKIVKGYSHRKQHPDFRIWTISGLKDMLAEESLLQRTTAEGTKKRIPDVYLRASIEQRRLLLAGLLDTDGNVGGAGGVEFVNTNPHIAFGAYELAISLGYRATINEGRSKLNGVDHGRKWQVSFTCEESPFRLSRKTATFKERYGNRNSQMTERRFITEVVKIPSVPARCIQVDSPSKMFLVGREMIPTHNSVTQRTLLMHVLQSPEWRIALVDPKRVELAAYRDHANVVAVATELEESADLIQNVEKEMQARYIQMQKESVNFFKNLADPPPALLLMVDETYALLAPEGIKSDEGKERDALHARITLLIGSIARLGRAAGVHMILATQRPDAKVIPGETKSLNITTPIITPSGWTTMEHLEVGDEVFDALGQPVKVIKATEIMYGHECYEIEFSDGEKIIADAGHLWKSHDNLYRMAQIRAKRRRRQDKVSRPYRQPIIVSTKEMSETLGYHGKNNHAIPVSSALELPEADLPVAPYLMGCWIGDGYSRTGSICGMDREIIDYIVADGDTVESFTGDQRKHPDFGTWKIQGLTTKLNALGLIQKTTVEGTQKRIPEIYLRASIAQRMLLLKGLMDTDGHYAQRISKNGSIANSQAVFTTCLAPLSEQVLELVRSLGYRGTINTEKKRDGVTGEVLNPAEFVYHVKWTPREAPFRLSRKIALLNGKPVETERTKYRYVVAVRPVDSVPVKCIAVDSDDHLFLAGKAMIPTHNSNLDARIAQGRMDSIPSNMTLDSDRATRIPAIKGRAVLRTGNDLTEFQAYYLPEEQLDLVMEMSEALATGQVDISAFDEEEPEVVQENKGRFKFKLPKISFRLPSLPSAIGERLSDFMDSRRAVAEANDAKSQAAIEWAKNGGKGSNTADKGKDTKGGGKGARRGTEPAVDPSDRDEIDFNAIAQEALANGVTGMDLHSRRQKTHPSLEEPPPRRRRDPEELPTHHDDDEFEDFEDSLQHDFRALEDAIENEVPLRHSPRILPPHLRPLPDGYEELSKDSDDSVDEPRVDNLYHDDIDESVEDALADIAKVEEATHMSSTPSTIDFDSPSLHEMSFDLSKLRPITVEQVLAKADELGVPIPAGELFEALQYEAALEAAGMPIPRVHVPIIKDELDPIVNSTSEALQDEPEVKLIAMSDDLPLSIPMVTTSPGNVPEIHPLQEEPIGIPMPTAISRPRIVPPTPPSGIFATTFIPPLPTRPIRKVAESVSVAEPVTPAGSQRIAPFTLDNDDSGEAPWMPRATVPHSEGNTPFGSA